MLLVYYKQFQTTSQFYNLYLKQFIYYYETINGKLIMVQYNFQNNLF